MKLSILFCTAFFMSYFSVAQEIKLEISGETILEEEYSAKNEGVSMRKIKLKVTRDGLQIPNFSIPITIVDSKITAGTKDYRIINNHIVLTTDDFNKRGSEFEIDIYLEVMKDDEKADKGDEVFSVEIIADLSNVAAPFFAKIGEKANITIKDAPKEKYAYDPFRITVGANFDFEKAVEATLYFDAQAYRPNLLLLCGKDQTSEFGVGFYGSLYSNKYISQDSVQRIEDQFSEVIGSGDTIDLVKYNYEFGFSNSIKNVGAEGGLIWGWDSKIDDDTYVANTFIFPEISAIHRRITTTRSYSKINLDTLFQVPMPDSTRYLVEQEFTTSKYNEVLFGGGYIGRFHSNTYGEFMFKFTSGLAFQKSTVQRIILPYYSFRFQMIDPKVGINLGGEVRGYYNQPFPFFGVYLSKSFGLKKLIDYGG